MNCSYAENLSKQWFVACQSSELRDRPIARTILERPVVLFRDRQRIVAMLDRCPHRHAPLSAGRLIHGCVQCPYHGWQFDQQGQCVARPGLHQAPSHPITIPVFAAVELNGLVWIRLKESDSAIRSSSNPPPPPDRPWFYDQTFSHFTWQDTVEANFADALENLLDATHTPFVHSGLVRDGSRTQKFSAIVRVRHGLAEAEYFNESKQSGWISQLFERDRANSFGRFIPPCLAELEYTSKRGTQFVLNSFFTPETSDRIRVYSMIFLRRSWIPLLIQRSVVTPFFRRVLKQDQRILRLQQANIRRHSSADYVYWEGDLLRGLIDTWLETGSLPQSIPERRIELEL